MYIYILIRVIIKQVATSWDHHQSANHNHNHHHFVEWAAYMDKLHTVLILFLTYTTKLHGKHRTLPWDQDRDGGLS